MNRLRLMAATISLATMVAIGLVFAPHTRGDIGANTGAHANQIWGSIQTGSMAPDGYRLDEMTIVIRRIHQSRPGRIVGIGSIDNSNYSIDMGKLPAGKYLVQVEPGDSFYLGGERLVSYPGPGGVVNQNWTVYTDRSAIPALD